MCLIVDADLTHSYIESSREEHKFYKVVGCSIVCGKIFVHTPYQKMSIASAGIQRVSNPLNDDCSQLFKIECRALHLYRTWRSAFYFKGGCCNHRVDRFVIQVYVKREDILAAGYSTDIAVKQYEIKQEDWDELIKKSTLILKE